MKKLLNVEYGSIHAFYWMSYGVLASFASVFLLARGYSNTDIGMIFAAANVLAVVLQPVLADMADRSKRISLTGISELVTALLMVLCFGLLALTRRSVALSMVYVLLLAGNAALQPLLNSLCFRLSESGIHINFGVCRSCGSLAYAVLCMFLGTLVEEMGIMVLPAVGEAVMALTLASLFLAAYHFRRACTMKNGEAEATGDDGSAVSEANAGKPYLEKEPEKKQERGTDQAIEKEIDLAEFVRRNRMYMVMMLGVLGIYFSNGVLNNFMLQIITPLGGDSEDMGRIFSVMAFLEIPTLVFFERINRRFSCQSLLKVASAAFVVKTALIWKAPSVIVVFLSHGFQLFSFALFLPAMVNHIDQTMSRGEAVKGQAFYTAMITAATVICSLLGGRILDLHGAGMLMMLSTLLTAVGAVIIFLTVGKVGNNRDRS